MGYLLGIPLLLFGVAVGLFFPDLDQRLPFFLHRSIITHTWYGHRRRGRQWRDRF